MREPQEVNSPLTVTRDTSATPEQVWAVIADGWTYSQWVVGNSRVRAVDADWPAPGSKIHHTIGIWPPSINDETTVEACTPRQELVLHAKTRPFGGARITLRLKASPTGCRMEMSEVPVGGPLSLVPRRLALAAACPGIGNARGGWPRLPSVGHNRNEPGKAVTRAVTPPAARDEAAGGSAPRESRLRDAAAGQLRETVAALGEKVDVKRRAEQKVAETLWSGIRVRSSAPSPCASADSAGRRGRGRRRRDSSTSPTPSRADRVGAKVGGVGTVPRGNTSDSAR